MGLKEHLAKRLALRSPKKFPKLLPAPLWPSDEKDLSYWMAKAKVWYAPTPGIGEPGHLPNLAKSAFVPMNNTVAKAACQGTQLPFCWRSDAPSKKTQTMSSAWPGTRPATLVLPVSTRIHPIKRLKEKLAKPGEAMVLLAEVSSPVAREETRRLASFG